MRKDRGGNIEIWIGLLLLAAALVLSEYNIIQTRNAGTASEAALKVLGSQIAEAEEAQEPSEDAWTGAEAEYPDYVLNPQMPMPEKEIDGLNYLAVLQIPALELELPILADYVYDHLRRSPCRYYGSVYTEDMVICAHNYSSHFGRLKNLAYGDAVILTDMDGNVFTYEIQEILVLNPTLVEEFTESGYDLTLFTCTLGGASRVVVRCSLKEPLKNIIVR